MMNASAVDTRAAPDQQWRAAGAALITVLVWASAFVGIRVAGRQLGPGELALARLTVGTVVLGAVVLARGERLPRGRGLGATAVCGLLWFGLYNVALNAGERRVEAGIAAMLVNIGPILIAVLAGSVLGEGFPRRLLAGCAVSFTGVAVIGLAVSGHGVNETWGVVLCLISALAYAGGVVAQKPVLRSASALSVTWVACAVGALSCLPYAPALAHQLSHARAGTVAWILYLGVAPTAIGFVTWAYALARTTAGRMGSTTYLVPPLAVLLGWVGLGEVPPLLTLPGGLLCLAGVALTRTAAASARAWWPARVRWPARARRPARA